MGLLVPNDISLDFDSLLASNFKDALDLSAGHAADLFVAIALPMLLIPACGALTDPYGPK